MKLKLKIINLLLNSQISMFYENKLFMEESHLF